MSNRPPGSNAVVYGIVIVVVATILAAAAVLIFAPDTDVAPLVGIVAPTVAALGALAATQRVAGQVEKVDQRTEDLTNGLMDSKIRAGVADVIPDHLLDETYTRHQLAKDRLRARVASDDSAARQASKDDPIT